MRTNSNRSISESEMMLWSPIKKDAESKMEQLEWYLNVLVVRRIYHFNKTGHKEAFDSPGLKALENQLQDFYLMGNQILHETATGDVKGLKQRKYALFSRVKELEKELKYWSKLLGTDPTNNPNLTNSLVKQVLEVRWQLHADTWLKNRIRELEAYLRDLTVFDSTVIDAPRLTITELTREDEDFVRKQRGPVDGAFKDALAKADDLGWSSAFDQLSQAQKQEFRVVKKRLIADIECWMRDMEQLYERRRRQSRQEARAQAPFDDYDPWTTPYEERY